MNPVQSEALGDPEIASRVASYELAFRMQASVPTLADLIDEPYGPTIYSSPCPTISHL